MTAGSTFLLEWFPGFPLLFELSIRSKKLSLHLNFMYTAALL